MLKTLVEVRNVSVARLRKAHHKRKTARRPISCRPKIMRQVSPSRGTDALLLETAGFAI
jgi:hypothetical protein